MKRPLVGIDLAPASLTESAPGTARHVHELAKALAELDVPWDWAPTVEAKDNPLSGCFRSPTLIVTGKGVARRAWWKLGEGWKRAGCSLGFAGTAFAPWSGPPVVANLFDSNIYEHGDTWVQSGNRKGYWLNRMASDHALWRAEKLFILSDYCRHYLSRRFPQHAHKLVAIPCGLNSWPPPGARPGWAMPLDRPYFVYVGTFSENKNQRRLIEAWSLLQSSGTETPGLVLVGPCPEEFRAYLQPAVNKLRFPERVVFTGRIPAAEVAWAYTNALAAIQPSIAEGFGLPVIEAMNFGLPVACSNTTSLPETAGGAACLFDPFEPQKIAESAARLWLDAGLREKLRELGRDRSSQFSWQRSAEMTANVLEGVLRELKCL